MTDFGSKPSPVSSALAARLMAALEAAKAAADSANSEQRATSASLARQHGDLEAVQEWTQKLATRSRDIRNSLQVLRESVDRARLSALNAGLEGARLGEPTGKALVVMSDEQRNLLARALDALEEHSALLAEVERDRDRCLVALAQLSEGTRNASGTLRRANEKSQLTSALLHELRTDFGELLGSDPEAARAMAEAAARLKTAADSLFELTQTTPLAGEALREILSPLMALIPAGKDHPR
jgi:methyl-accepting chemotaxis protein